jgi:peptidoglycan/xylan/chitin deacetylase (PgdA/CDA1 family)
VGDVLVLAYHAVSDTWPADLSVTVDEFERQLDHLVRAGYRGATLTDAMEGRRTGKVVVVTFDDAYVSVLQRALPVLASLGLPGTVFVPTDFADRDGPMSWPGISQWVGGEHEPEMHCLSWEQLGGLVERGWEVGSHTCSHPHLTTLDDDALHHELHASREVCERELGRPCPTLAYPYGDHDARVVAATEAAGYRWACALPAQAMASHHLRVRRVGIYRGESWLRHRAKVSPLVRRARETGLLEPAVRRLRRA